MKRVLFTLSMPNVGSANGKWSGERPDYTIIRNVPPKRAEELDLPKSFYHNFGDGWGASVHARAMAVGERSPKSAGFCGYDWMVDRIIWWGDTQCRHEWQDDPMSGQPGFDGQWVRCKLCQQSHRTDSEAKAMPKPEMAAAESAVTP